MSALTAKTALVTGASSGLGLSYARHLAGRGYALVLVARAESKLEKVAAQLRDRTGVAVEVLPADLAVAEERERVCRRLQGGVHLLVNNAGYTLAENFLRAPWPQVAANLDVNVTAVVELSRAAMNYMLPAGEGAIINVASIAGLVPGSPGIYGASKAFVVSFTEGLAQLAAGTGVRVQALCPGLVRTDFHRRSGLQANAPEQFWLSADEVVRESLRRLPNGPVIVIPTWRYRVVTAASRMLPRGAIAAIGNRVASRAVERELNGRNPGA